MSDTQYIILLVFIMAIIISFCVYLLVNLGRIVDEENEELSRQAQ